MRNTTISIILLTMVALSAVAVATVPRLDLPTVAQRAADTEMSLLIAAAEAGDPAAQYALARRHESGKGADKDYVQAARWYARSAAQRFADAQNSLGCLHLLGWGVPLDYQAAARLFETAAEQGHAGAQNNLGSLYYRGIAVPRNYETAAAWYRRAASHGQEVAQLNLALMHVHGHGVERDLIEAYMWLSISATNGSHSARRYLPQLALRLSEEEIAIAHNRARHQIAAEDGVLAARAMDP